MDYVVEVCCGSYNDACAAQKGGAKRIELNSALYMGGLTPSLATLIATKQKTSLEVMVMIRPRGAGFHYSQTEFDIMKADAELMLQHSADGIVFGCLNAEGEIDFEQTSEMVVLVKHYGKKVVFHRAFDCVKDKHQAIKQLITLGVDRILTSGGYATAPLGQDVLKELQESYGHAIEIVAGSGINDQNANALLEKTGIRQIHSSCKSWYDDPTTCAPYVSFTYEPLHPIAYDIVDEVRVQKLIKSIKKS